MFEVQHDHHGQDFQRIFSPGRSSMSAVEDKRAEAFRRHVWTVTMIDEDPLSGKMSRHTTDMSYSRTGPNKLRSKKRASAHAALPSSTPPPTALPAEQPTTPPAVVQKKQHTPKPESKATSTMRGPTVTVQPVHPASFGPAVTELYSVKEDSVDEFLSRSEKKTVPRTSYPAYAIYPGLQTPAVEPISINDSLPAAKQHRPRKLSNGSTVSMASMYSNSNESMRMSMASRQRTPSWGSRTSVESAEPAAKWRPEYLTQRPLNMQTNSQKTVRATYHPNELFAKLPNEVLGLILSKLRDLHLDPPTTSCATCWMRDACNVSMSSRKLHKIARTVLYENIQLVGADSASHKKRYKLNQGGRLMLLRRTLRANPYLAGLVRSLKVPAPEPVAKGGNVNDYDNLVATLVMACPNLESLSGLTTTYEHSFKKIFHSLYTRRKLKEMNWLVQASPHQKQQRIHSSTQQLGLVMPGELMRYHEIAFLNHHSSWTSLETLTIQCYQGASLSPENLLITTLRYLPALKHLHLCNIPPNGFNDKNLLALPVLHSLTLSNVTGITSNGLSSFATRSNSASLRKLQLRHILLDSLAALARILSNLRSLTSFSLVQASSPVMPEEDSFTLWMMPYLASSSLKKLHWDITAHSMSINNAADDILARSIAAGGFPELKLLRVPNDPDGLFQDLCYPVERIDLPTDRFRTPETPVETPNLSPVSNSSPISPTRYLFKSTSTTSLSSPRTPQSPTGNGRQPPYTNLHAARLAAQARLEAAHSRPRFTVNVVDEDGTTTETFPMAGFIGTAGSQIKYHLLPDEGSTDEKGGLMDVRDLENDGGESLANGQEGCSGRWNTREGMVADRREKEKWWHTERGRWVRPAL